MKRTLDTGESESEVHLPSGEGEPKGEGEGDDNQPVFVPQPLPILPEHLRSVAKGKFAISFALFRR